MGLLVSAVYWSKQRKEIILFPYTRHVEVLGLFTMVCGAEIGEINIDKDVATVMKERREI